MIALDDSTTSSTTKTDVPRRSQRLRDRALARLLGSKSKTPSSGATSETKKPEEETDRQQQVTGRAPERTECASTPERPQDDERANPGPSRDPGKQLRRKYAWPQIGDEPPANAAESSSRPSATAWPLSDALLACRRGLRAARKARNDALEPMAKV